MTMSIYPAYRESGIDIIDVLPSHWETSKVARIAKAGYRTFIDGDWIESPYITDRGIRLIQTGNVGIGIFKEQGYRFISDETFHLLKCTEVIPNNVLICRLAAPVGRACLAPKFDDRMITSVDVCILKVSDDWDARYVTYFFSSKPYLDLMGAVSRGGTRDRISRSFLGNVRIAKPTISEQTKIADFLDRETAEADALVAKYERLIELLEEKRIALITQAVTKGLDHKDLMKESGIEWMGDIPAHWEIRPLKHLFRFEKGKNAQRLTSKYIQDHPGRYPVYSGQTDNNGIMGLIDTFDYAVDEVLFSTTVGAKVMTPLTLRGEFSLSQNCLIGIPNKSSTCTDFFYYALHPLFSFHRASIPDHMQPSLRVADIANFPVMFPSLTDQKKIAECLKETDARN